MTHNTTLFLESWANTDGNVNTTEDILDWIRRLNEETYVRITETEIQDGSFWFFDSSSGEILNQKRSFFSIKGMRWSIDNKFMGEQPVIVQPEIGYLGIICKVIDGVLNFLMQAKIEPGNVNSVQLSPTIQATKSNFTRVHGGASPAYFEYFKNSTRHHVIYDQIQSEQAARFYKKRNRNMIMLLDEDIEVLKNFKWMTLGQIKELMRVDNLVNMDTRTVLSGIPLISIQCECREDVVGESSKSLFQDEQLFDSLYRESPLTELPGIYQKINNFKMFHDVETSLIPLNQLSDWRVNDHGVTCNEQADFEVRYYNINISGREVQEWTQPLFKAMGMATFGLITRQSSKGRQFLVKLRPEIGTFDKVELGPTIQQEYSHNAITDEVESIFRKHIAEDRGLLKSVVLSEEGGRFYHEQNHNYIVEIDSDELKDIPEEYLWVSLGVLNYLVQINNCLNIQLRNLISLIDL
jgi:oxidase EvaA